IALVEGQRPILATKLYSYDRQPFKAEIASAVSHPPDVPITEFVPHLPVPAVNPLYGRAADTVGAAGEPKRSPPAGPASTGQASVFEA
ncbi:hypothetical protein SB658_24820, partial [Bacillus sp. SIMBA_008]|uniref:hypothetical protein n=1 Tax=Bacillus sp. SIMBA_008 TaxID=3085757 RepID=UPI00397E881D